MYYLVTKNEHSLIGLFQGMFEGNIITFNPGWDQSAKALKEFDDVRAIQTDLMANAVKLEKEADLKTNGPESIVLIDPDGNSILIDQHV